MEQIGEYMDAIVVFLSGVGTWLLTKARSLKDKLKWETRSTAAKMAIFLVVFLAIAFTLSIVTSFFTP